MQPRPKDILLEPSFGAELTGFCFTIVSRYFLYSISMLVFLDTIANLISYPFQSVGEWVSESFKCDEIASLRFISLCLLSSASFVPHARSKAWGVYSWKFHPLNNTLPVCMGSRHSAIKNLFLRSVCHFFLCSKDKVKNPCSQIEFDICKCGSLEAVNTIIEARWHFLCSIVFGEK